MSRTLTVCRNCYKERTAPFLSAGWNVEYAARKLQAPVTNHCLSMQNLISLIFAVDDVLLIGTILTVTCKMWAQSIGCLTPALLLLFLNRKLRLTL